MKYRVKVSEHRIYETWYEVEAEDEEEAREKVEQYDDDVVELSDEMVDGVNSTILLVRSCEDS